MLITLDKTSDQSSFKIRPLSKMSDVVRFLYLFVVILDVKRKITYDFVKKFNIVISYLALEVIRNGNKLLRCWALSRPILDKIGQETTAELSSSSNFCPAPF